MRPAPICYSICERKRYKYVTSVDNDTIKLGVEDDRLFFYDECDAENYRQLADETMDGCFQIIIEKMPTDVRIDRIIANDMQKQFETSTKDSNTVLTELIMPVGINVSELSHRIFQIYNNAEDKKSIKALFEAIFNISFDEYLAICESTVEKMN